MQEEEEETMNFASQTIQLHLWTHVRVLAMTIFMLPLQWDTLSTHPLTEQVNDVLAGQINASGNGNDYADKNGGGGVRGCDRLMAHTIKSSGCQPSNEDSMQTMALPSWANCWLDDEDYICWRKHVVIVCRGGGRRHHNVLEVNDISVAQQLNLQSLGNVIINFALQSVPQISISGYCNPN